MDFIYYIRSKNITVKNSFTGEIVPEKHYNRIYIIIHNDIVIFKRKINTLSKIYFCLLFYNTNKYNLADIENNSTIYIIIDNLLVLNNNYEKNTIFVLSTDNYKYYDIFYLLICNDNIPYDDITNNFDNIIDLYEKDINIIVELIRHFPDKITKIKNENIINICNIFERVLKNVSKFSCLSIKDAESLIEKKELLLGKYFDDYIFSLNYNDYNDIEINLIKIIRINILIRCPEHKHIARLSKDDEHIIIESVRYSELIYDLLPDELRTKAVTIAAIKFNYRTIKKSPNILLQDNETINDFINCNYSILEYISDKSVVNKETLKKILIYDVNLLNFYSFDEIKNIVGNDKELALLMVKGNGILFKFVSKDLSEDREIILTAVSNDSIAMKYVLKHFWIDEEILLIAVKNKRKILQFFPYNFSDYKELILKVLRLDKYAIKYIPINTAETKAMILDIRKELNITD